MAPKDSYATSGWIFIQPRPVADMYFYCQRGVLLSLTCLANQIRAAFEMGKYRVLRFEFPASSSPNFEFPASENSDTLIESSSPLIHPSFPLAEKSANLIQPSSPLIHPSSPQNFIVLEGNQTVCFVFPHS